MVVRRQSATLTKFSHDDETRTVREGKVLVLPTKEPASCLLGSRWIDPFPQNPAASFDLIPPLGCCAESQPQANKSQSFVQDIVRGEQDAAAPEPFIPRDSTHFVPRICRIGHGHPSARVDEKSSNRLH